MVVVDRHERFLGVAEDALQFAFGSGLHDAVHFVDRRRALRDEGEVDDGHVDRRDAHRVAVELAVQVREDEAHGGGGTGLRGDHRHRGGTGAAEVLVIDVRQHLVVRVRMDRRHQAGHQADLLVQRLDHRGQAVRRAGGVGDDGVARFQRVVVHAVDDRRVDVLAGRGDDDLARAAGEVQRRLVLAGEEARAFHHDVDVEGLPRELRRVALGEHLDDVAVDDHRIAGDLDRAVEAAVGRVEAGQVGVRLGAAEVVDRDDLDLAVAAGFVQRAQDVPADAAVAVDGDADGHVVLPGQKRTRF